MKSFKQFIFESIEFKKPDMGFGTMAGLQDHPISVGAKNINHARKGLYDNKDKSQAPGTNTEDMIRALYDAKAKKFYVWYSVDTIHHDVEEYYKLQSTVELYYTPSTKEIQVKVVDPLNKKHEKTWNKFFGKNAKYDTHTPNNELFK